MIRRLTRGRWKRGWRVWLMGRSVRLLGRFATTPGGDRLDWRIEETTGPGSAIKIAARCASDGVEIIAAAGGDGTLSEVLNGVIGTGAVLGLLPIGTGNDFSRTVGLYGSLPRAVDTLFAGVSRRIDIGRAA